MLEFDASRSGAARRLKTAVANGELRFAAPLTEDAVVAFEEAHQIRLPAEYRWLVTELGNGGEGPPYYGVEPLSDGLIERNSRIHPAQNRNRRLADPFPGRAADWSEESEDRADDAWAAYEAGRLLLGTDGCAILWVLVVSGEARGEVWRLGDDSASRAEPRSLLDWYCAWLDRRGPRRPDDPMPLALGEANSERGGRERSLIRRLLGRSG